MWRRYTATLKSLSSELVQVASTPVPLPKTPSHGHPESKGGGKWRLVCALGDGEDADLGEH